MQKPATKIKAGEHFTMEEGPSKESDSTYTIVLMFYAGHAADKEKYVIFPFKQKDVFDQAKANGHYVLARTQLKKLSSLYKVALDDIMQNSPPLTCTSLLWILI